MLGAPCQSFGPLANPAPNSLSSPHLPAMYAAWMWLATNHIRAIYRVNIAELTIVKWLFSIDIGFAGGWRLQLSGGPGNQHQPEQLTHPFCLGMHTAVTNKDRKKGGSSALRAGLSVVWPHILYYFLFVASLVKVIVDGRLLGSLCSSRGSSGAAAN